MAGSVEMGLLSPVSLTTTPSGDSATVRLAIVPTLEDLRWRMSFCTGALLFRGIVNSIVMSL
jgi:hypothetical protein